MSLILACDDANDLCRVLSDSSVEFRRFDHPLGALAGARSGDGVLILADRRAAGRTAVDAGFYDEACSRGVRLYVECPALVPGVVLGPATVAEWHRVVVASDAFAPDLGRLRILSMHECPVIACDHPRAHLVRARVAGFDTAVYGLPDGTEPVLFEHDDDVLVATAALSGFVTGRYAPASAWELVWRWIIGWASSWRLAPELAVTPTVAPSYDAREPLPHDAEERAARRGAAWYRAARLLIPPDREEEARRRLETFPDGTGPGPDDDWPAGDGSRGMIEGASSRIGPDGSQAWRYHVRGDCMGEASMAIAAAWAVERDPEARRVAVNLNDYIHSGSVLSSGPRDDPASPSYGLRGWTTLAPADGVYYGDDNARSMLGTMTASALLGTDRWDEPLMRCLLANFRTTGPLGFRGGRLEEADLQRLGWRHYRDLERTNYAPHYESWLWACFIAAYRHTRFEPFLHSAATAIRMTMDAYPHHWRWTNGIQQERARMLLPLSWLVRVDDRPEHREWLRFMASELLRRQDASGAIGEEVGAPGHGAYGPPASNEAYGTSEAPLIHENGDPLCDLLYTTNFAFVGLHEAAAATGEAPYREAEDRLARFLCRAQVRSASHPELDGGWFRAFDFRRWDYWGSNADAGWGAWSIESGWTVGWITTILALRRMRTSLWDLHGTSAIASRFASLLAVMLPS